MSVRAVRTCVGPSSEAPGLRRRGGCGLRQVSAPRRGPRFPEEVLCPGLRGVLALAHALGDGVTLGLWPCRKPPGGQWV